MTILEIYDIIELASSKPGNEKHWLKSQEDFFSLNLTEPRILITGKINILAYNIDPDRIWYKWCSIKYGILWNDPWICIWIHWEDHTSVMLKTSPSVNNDASSLMPLMIAITDIYIIQLKQICRYFTNLLNLYCHNLGVCILFVGNQRSYFMKAYKWVLVFYRISLVSTDRKKKL